MLFVGPETDEKALQAMEKADASIPLLTDLEGEAMDSYPLSFELPEHLRERYQSNGLIDPSRPTGWRLPIPATFVIGQDGVVAERHVNADYTYRMDPEDVIAALRALGS